MAPPKSDVWLHFEKIGLNQAQCKKCSKICARAGGTSNLLKHLEIYHDIKRKRNLVGHSPHQSSQSHSLVSVSDIY